MGKRIIAKLGQELHPAHLARIIAEEKKQTEWILNNKIFYPDPKTVPATKLLPTLPAHFSFPSDIDNFFSGDRMDYFNRRNKKNKGGKQGGGKGGGKQGGNGGGSGGGKLPNPQLVHQVVSTMLAGVPLAGLTGDLRIFETNIENANVTKIAFFANSYVEIGTRAHAWMIEECDSAAAKKLAALLGYQCASSDENSRGQAIHILWNDGRLEKTDMKIYKSIANVQGIPDLRPALRVDFKDKVTGKEFGLVCLHLKSMRGGPKVTSVVRHKQFVLLAQDLGTEFKGLVGGDLNYPLNNPQFQEGDPMYQAGYKLVAPNDSQATQIIGSRIDGFFERGMEFEVDLYQVFPYFTQIGRAFTDHASLSVDLLVTDAKKINLTSGSEAAKSSKLVGGSNLPVLKVVPVGRKRRAAK